MIRNFILLVLATFTVTTTIAQDTTWVNTLNFSDITKRRGTYTFPEGKTYRKINMHYTLKCDPATTRDRFNCGEWDYLSYVIVHDSTGVIDSNEFEHSNFLIGDLAPVTFNHVNSSVGDTFYRYDKFRVVNSVLASDSIIIGVGNNSSSEAIDENRVQYLYTASELIAAGLKPGEITGLSVFVNKTGSTISNFQISLAQTPINTLTGFYKGIMSTVFSGDFDGTLGKNRIQCFEPILWDGVSNLVVEFARNENGILNMPELQTDMSFTTGIQEVGTDRYYQITENNFMEIENPETVFKDIDSAITISFWAKGSSSLPKNTSVLEAKDKDGKRLLNIHFPWSNGQVYWDAGNSSGYDRINKAVDANTYKNSWNHWVFTKNVKTGSLKIYLNGSLFHSGTGLTRELGNNIATFRVGKGISNYQYDGSIDRLSIWKSELSATEILDLQSKEITNTQPNFNQLICAFGFDNYTNSSSINSDFTPTIKAGFKGKTIINSYAGGSFFNTKVVSERPKVEFVSSDQTTMVDSILRSSVEQRPYTFIDLFEDEKNPTTQTGVMTTFEGGHTFSYNPDGTTKDSSIIPGSQVLQQKMTKYYVPYEVVNNAEIARYITPYGIGLDLGPEGFRWVYDVTDYASLLAGDVTFSAGNQQELIDVRFEMIEGTPVRDLKEISYYINRESRSYRNIADDVNFQEMELAVNPDAKTFKLVTRITGHGHNTDDDTKPHCCEWADKKHYIKIDGKDALEWDIWQDDKCALNPIFDQGGNWAPPRAGWCPGAPVDDYNFDVTEYVTGDKVLIDYEIEPVPTTNLGQGGGNYVVSMHLMQYGEYNFQNDAAVEEIISPTNWELHLRQNPTCGKPKIKVRNTGKNVITELGLRYGVVGGNPITYYWKDTLNQDEAKVVELPFAIWDYLSDENSNRFYAEIFAVNKVDDEYADNNRAESEFEIPNMAPKTFTVYFRNNKIADATLQIFDDGGNAVYEQLTAPAEQLIKEDITLNPGCYKLVCETENEFGLSYPLIPQIGSGLLRLINTGAGFNETFNPDFGKSLVYYFTVGYTLADEEVTNEIWKLFPNPSSGLVTLQKNVASEGKGYELLVYNISGQKVLRKSGIVQGGIVELDLKEFEPGMYFIEMIEDNQKTSFKVSKH